MYSEWGLLSLVLFDPVLNDFLLFWDCFLENHRSIAIAEASVFLSDLTFFTVAPTVMVVFESTLMPLFVYSKKDVAANLNHFNRPAHSHSIPSVSL
jgi:hypothetical protein